LLAPFFFMVPLLRLETLGFIIMGISWTVGAFLLLRGLVTWRMSIFAVTQRRLIVVRQKGLSDRRVIELPFSKIHEVAYQVKGMWATLCRYGTLLVESAGSDEPIEMEKVAHPRRVQELVTELQEQAARGAGDFGEVLQSVSRMDAKKLAMLKSEIQRAERALEPEPPKAP
jgi:hypothetical protein